MKCVECFEGVIIAGHEFPVYKLIWGMHKRALPKGAVIRRKCGNPLCVNPYHLYLGSERCSVVTKRANQNTSKTYCDHGHPLTPSNLYNYRSGVRVCKLCKRAKWKEYVERKKLGKVLSVGRPKVCISTT